MPATDLAQRPERLAPWAVLPSTLAAIAHVQRYRLSGWQNANPIKAGETQNVQRLASLSARTSSGGGTQTAGAVAVLSIRGLITPRPSLMSWLFGGGGGLEEFRENFAAAIGDDDITAIVLDIDSPGGSVELLPETAADIRNARGSKPIVAVANTLAASAAYWLAAQADELVVTPSGEVGSIGVYTAHEDWSKFDEEMGVKTTLISAGKFKTEGNPLEPLDDDAKAAIQATVDDFYAMFVADVALGRGIDEAAVRAGYGEGRVLPAARALAAGMVDRVESYDQAIGRLVGAARAGLKSALPTAALAATALAADTTPPPARREESAPVIPPWLAHPTPMHR